MGYFKIYLTKLTFDTRKEHEILPKLVTIFMHNKLIRLNVKMLKIIWTYKFSCDSNNFSLAAVLLGTQNLVRICT